MKTQKQKRKYENGTTKLMEPPVKYESGFLMKLDGRTETCKLLRAAYDEILSDLGGPDSLSHVQLCLCERFVFLEFVLRQIEARIVTEPKRSSKLLARVVQSLNAIVGLAKSIGLHRRAKKVPSLQKYIKDKRQ